MLFQRTQDTPFDLSTSDESETTMFGDIAASDLWERIEQVSDAVEALAVKVDAQFVTIASHADIARRATEFSRSEATNSIQRLRQQVLSLVDHVRHDIQSGIEPSTGVVSESRLASLERTTALSERLITEMRSVQRSFDERLAALEARA